MNDEPSSHSEIILYKAEDGRTRIQCRFERETIWLTQALIAELFEKDVRTINEHLANIFDERELEREATIRKFRIVRTEGKRPEWASAKDDDAEAESGNACVVKVVLTGSADDGPTGSLTSATKRSVGRPCRATTSCRPSPA